MLLLAALFDFAFAVFHLLFWRLFGWPQSLAASGRINADVTQVLNLCLTYAFLAASVWLALGDPPPGALLAMTGFWAFRAALQPWFFGLRDAISLSLFALFVAGAILHAVPLLARL